MAAYGASFPFGAWRKAPLTGAREKPACPTVRRPPHTRAMTGSPLKRQRKAGVVDPVTGELVPFPYLRHPRAGLSNAQWRALSPGEKIERLLNMSLDRAAEILTWPVSELDPLRLSLLIGPDGHADRREDWGMRTDPVGQRLSPARLGIGEIGGTMTATKNLRRTDSPGPAVSGPPVQKCCAEMMSVSVAGIPKNRCRTTVAEPIGGNASGTALYRGPRRSA